MSTTTKKEVPPAADLSRIKEGRMEEIKEVFATLGLPYDAPYPGLRQFGKTLRKAGRLRYEGVQFSVTSSSQSPFETTSLKG